MLIELILSSNVDCNDIATKINLDAKNITSVPCLKLAQKILIDVDEDTEDSINRILTVTLTGKSHKHTQIDDNDNIISDVVVNIDSIVFDEIDVTELFCSGQEIYQHDFNGTTDPFIDEFYGIIGCNGTISIAFTTPIYLWFLQQL